MWCKQCNIETNADICPVCGGTTVEDLPVEVYWCDSCKIPIINTIIQADKGCCPVCGGKTECAIFSKSLLLYNGYFSAVF